MILRNHKKPKETGFAFLFYYFDLGLIVLFIMRSVQDESDPLNSATQCGSTVCYMRIIIVVGLRFCQDYPCSWSTSEGVNNGNQTFNVFWVSFGSALRMSFIFISALTFISLYFSQGWPEFGVSVHSVNREKFEIFL